ncbi:hypothetical protein PTI98_012895 [Pleurotus ostreatus]|nr:hypothetical protein PTI98_012895 [Pleurotus ostreatus]
MHPFGMKRPALEQHFCGVFKQDNVTLVDLNESPIYEITSTWVRTKDGAEYALDLLVMATGFDSGTGGYNNIEMIGANGARFRDIMGEWGGRTWACWHMVSRTCS